MTANRKANPAKARANTLPHVRALGREVQKGGDARRWRLFPARSCVRRERLAAAGFRGRLRGYAMRLGELRPEPTRSEGAVTRTLAKRLGRLAQAARAQAILVAAT
jgi:hypothetical protein